MVPEVGISRIREMIFGAYRVIYSVGDRVVILTVRRGSQLLRPSELDAALKGPSAKLGQDQAADSGLNPARASVAWRSAW